MDEIYQKTGGKDESKVKERVGCHGGTTTPYGRIDV